MNSGAWQATIHAVTELDMTGRLSLTHSSTLGASHVAPVVKNPPAKVGDTRDVGLILGWEDRLEWEISTYSCILAWKIPCTEELGGLQSMWPKESYTT